MSDRQTKKIKTPIDGHEVELLNYITGREQRAIDAVALSGVKLSLDDEKNFKFGEINSELGNVAEDKSIEVVVVSINGEKESLLDKVLEMKSGDFQFIVKEVNAVIQGLTEDSKKK